MDSNSLPTPEMFGKIAKEVTKLINQKNNPYRETKEFAVLEVTARVVRKAEKIIEVLSLELATWQAAEISEITIDKILATTAGMDILKSRLDLFLQWDTIIVTDFQRGTCSVIDMGGLLSRAKGKSSPEDEPHRPTDQIFAGDLFSCVVANMTTVSCGPISEVMQSFQVNAEILSKEVVVAAVAFYEATREMSANFETDIHSSLLFDYAKKVAEGTA